MARLFKRVIGAAASLSLISSVAAIMTISQKGQKFFTSDGNQWYIKGVAYQLNGLDLGTDGAQCQRDAALMQQLGANTIRVYHVDPSLDHDACMQAFENAGIYVFVDLDTFSSTVVETNPTWTPTQLGAFRFVMDAFQKYDNVAGFFIGNEVVNEEGAPTEAMAYVKAAVADLKAYRNAMNYRTIPIGYSHADVAGLRPVLQNYLACGDPAQAIDFFGLNAYEWCGASSYDQSGYHALYDQTVDYPVPIFFSETGCIVPRPRLFTDQTAIFGPMADVWSGAIIYEWIEESNAYGLITYSGDTNADAQDNPGYVRSGTPTPMVPDFANLQTQWATLNPTGVQEAAYQATLPPMACPAYTAGVWEVDPNAPLPTLGLNVAIPTASALAAANDGLSPPYSIPIAAALPSAASTSTTMASSSAPAPSTSTSSMSSPAPSLSSPAPTSATPSPSPSTTTALIAASFFSAVPSSSDSSTPAPAPSTSSTIPPTSSAAPTTSSTPAPSSSSPPSSSVPVFIPSSSATLPSSAAASITSSQASAASVAISSASSIRSSLQSSAASAAISSQSTVAVAAAGSGSTSTSTMVTSSRASSTSTTGSATAASTSSVASFSSFKAAAPSMGAGAAVVGFAGVLGAAAILI